MSLLDGFESTTTGAMWEPKQTGKGETLKALTPGDDSVLVGWYLGTETGVGNNDSTIHKMKVKTVGNREHIQGDVEGDVEGITVGVWGTGVLDSKFVDSNIQYGQCIAIKWEGKKKPLKGGKPYHNWDLLVPSDTSKYPPLAMNEMPAPAATSQAAPEASKPEEVIPAANAMDGGDDDDLPF